MTTTTTTTVTASDDNSNDKDPRAPLATATHVGPKLTYGKLSEEMLADHLTNYAIKSALMFKDLARLSELTEKEEGVCIFADADRQALREFSDDIMSAVKTVARIIATNKIMTQAEELSIEGYWY